MKKGISFVLCILMLFSICSVGAVASNSAPTEPESTPFTVYDVDSDTVVVPVNGEYQFEYTPGTQKWVYVVADDTSVFTFENQDWTTFTPQDSNFVIGRGKYVSEKEYRFFLTEDNNSNSGVGPMLTGKTGENDWSQRVSLRFKPVGGNSGNQNQGQNSDHPFVVYDGETGSVVPLDSGSYRMQYTPGEEKWVYVVAKDTSVFTFDDQKVEKYANNDSNGFKIIAGQYANNKRLEFFLTEGNTGEVSTSLHIRVQTGDSGWGSGISFRFSPRNNENGGGNDGPQQNSRPFIVKDGDSNTEVTPINGEYHFEYTPGTKKWVYVVANDTSVFTFESQEWTEFKPNDSNFVIGRGRYVSDKEYRFFLTENNHDNSGVGFSLAGKTGDKSWDRGISLQFKPIGGNDNPPTGDAPGGNNGPNPGNKISDERDFVPGTANDEYPGSYPSRPHFVAAVYACTIDGVDYYMAPIHWLGNEASQVYPGGSYDTDPALDPGNYEYRIYGIGFFTWHGDDEYVWVTDEAILSAIQDCFVEDSLTLNMKGMLRDDCFPDRYPAVYNPGNQVQTLLDAKGYMFGFPQKGQWIFTASGIRKEDNETVTSKMYFEFKPMKRVFWEADPNSSDNIITQVNNYLLNVTPDPDAWLIINLPAGDLYGYINVPERLDEMIVNITGEKNNSINQTKLHGGIISNNYLTLIWNIDFIGAGKNTEKYSQNISNYAISGTSGGNVRECTFKEYYHAVHLEDGMITSRQNTFTDNHTAIYFNITTNRGGDQDWRNNWFERNDVAIHFVSLSERLAMTWYYFSHSWFIDNKTDIDNDMKRNVYMPRCYFEHDGDVWDGFDHRRLQGKVFVYPTSKDIDFTDFFYARRNGKAGTADMEQGHIGDYDYSAFKGTLNIYSGDQLHHSWTTK